MASIGLLLEEAKRKRDERTMQGLQWLMERRLADINKQEETQKEDLTKQALVSAYKPLGIEFTPEQLKAPSHIVASIGSFRQSQMEKDKEEKKALLELTPKVEGLKKQYGDVGLDYSGVNNYKTIPEQYNYLTTLEPTYNKLIQKDYARYTNELPSKVAPLKPPTSNQLYDIYDTRQKDAQKIIEDNQKIFEQEIGKKKPIVNAVTIAYVYNDPNLRKAIFDKGIMAGTTDEQIAKIQDWYNDHPDKQSDFDKRRDAELYKMDNVYGLIKDRDDIPVTDKQEIYNYVLKKDKFSKNKYDAQGNMMSIDVTKPTSISTEIPTFATEQEARDWAETQPTGTYRVNVNGQEFDLNKQ